MAQTEAQSTIPTNPNLTNSFWVMTFGIFMFASSITQSRMDVREDVLIILHKRIEKYKKETEKLRKRIEEKAKEKESVSNPS
jgi:hypothetical protein